MSGVSVATRTTSRRRLLALALLCAVQFMVVLDVSIVNIALPSIEEDLGFSEKNLQWVVSGYALTFGGFLLLAGRAADLFGRRRFFMLGLAIFTASSLACGLAISDPMLVAARAAQGLGGRRNRRGRWEPSSRRTGRHRTDGGRSASLPGRRGALRGWTS
jgi:MFS family permease